MHQAIKPLIDESILLYLKNDFQGLEYKKLLDQINSSFDQLQNDYLENTQYKDNDNILFHLFFYFIIVSILAWVGYFLIRPIMLDVVSTMNDLEKANHRAEKANRIKSEFLANISHEIRTPLSAVIGYTDILMNRGVKEVDVDDMIDSIQKNANHLKGLIDDILDLSKVEAGTLEIKHSIINLHAFMVELNSIFAMKMKEKKLQFIMLLQTEVPERIVSDPVRLKQILVNLLSNAEKFTENGSVILQVSANDSDSNEFELSFTVTDTGIGIPARKVKKLFHRFTQIDSSISRKTGGTGLGLSLSRQLANLLGGDLILVETLPGKGSTFRLNCKCIVHTNTKMISTLDLESSSKDNHISFYENLKNTLVNVKILLVEDGKDNQRIYRHFLSIAGAHVESAWDGEEGIQKALSGEEYDIILMDLQLPKIDGYHVTSEIRAVDKKTPILALTAHAMSSDKGKCLSSGFTDFISKPVLIPELIETIMVYLDRSQVVEVHDHLGAEPQESGFTNQAQVIFSKYHNEKIFGQLICDFAAELESRIDDLKALFNNEQWDEIKKLAHKIKGAASTYGFPELSEISGDLEEVCKNGNVNKKIVSDMLTKYYMVSQAIQKGVNQISHSE